MRSRFGFGQLLFVLAAIGLALYGFRYAVSEGIRTAIASQPPPAKLAAPPSFSAFEGCDLGLTLYEARPSRPCDFTPPQNPETPAPIQTMSEADSEKAGAWFMLAGLGLPLALGFAALAGYWLTKGSD